MYSLYLDTSYFLSLGLLDEQMNFVEVSVELESKSSKVLHVQIQNLLKRHNLTLQEDISKLILSSGPGSYTGIRLAEGVAQLLELFKIDTYSFYHFELVDSLKNSAWVSKAYKGEYFVYRSLDRSKQLIKKDNLQSYLDECDSIFTHFSASLDFDLLTEIKSTYDLLKNNSSEIFSDLISKNIRKEPFYYRELEDEFTVSVKEVK